MKKVEYYVCEICGTECSAKAKAESCESCHCRPREIIDARYLNKAQNNSGYPITITVKMSDGTHQIYKR